MFAEYLSVSYPEDLPVTNAIVPIYTVLNCTSKDLAKKRYGNIRIRKVVATGYEITGSGKNSSTPTSSTRSMSLTDLFKDFITTQSPPLDDAVLKKCESLLESTATTNSIF